jgi:hypothetical protein
MRHLRDLRPIEKSIRPHPEERACSPELEG